jgi:hypothetical protein
MTVIYSMVKDALITYVTIPQEHRAKLVSNARLELLAKCMLKMVIRISTALT